MKVRVFTSFFRLKGSVNSNANIPGGPGHQWVKQRYRLDTHADHAEAQQRFRAGMGKKGIAFLGKRIT